MSNVPPPLLGFNNNVRHRGRIFHIQTEDSGVKNSRLVTHLFADGGRVIRTTRTEYAEHLARSDMQAFVRGLMKEQHKAMFMALRMGELDTLLENACGPFEQPLQPSNAPPAIASAPPPQAPPPPELRPNLAPTDGSVPSSRSRPSARFAAAPSKSSSSIFGEGEISEQSLDEVILSYLAEDSDDPAD